MRSQAARSAPAGAVLAALTLTLTVTPASAAPGTTRHVIPWSSGAGVQGLCADNGFACTRAGYDGTPGQVEGLGWTRDHYWAGGSPAGPDRRHNCKTYAAFRLKLAGIPYPGWTANASRWDTMAAAHDPGTRVDQVPAVGAVAVWNRGHVGYVEAVTPSYVEITADYWGQGSHALRITHISPHRPDSYVHFRAPALPTPPRLTERPAPPLPAPAYSGALLQRGSTGPGVGAVQRALSVPQTAYFGRLTRNAVIAFQTSHQLRPDGIVGPLTWAAIFG